jgi:hypothetical protein
MARAQLHQPGDEELGGARGSHCDVYRDIWSRGCAAVGTICD